MGKQTAIEWIETELSKLNNDISTFKTFKQYHKKRISLWEKAKQMEKEQIISFALELHEIDQSKTGTDILLDEAFQLYFKTYIK
jgi:hypothetical protein